MSIATTTTTRALDVPGAHLHHEVRGSGPLLLLIGAPMGATWFAETADLLADDHTVVTYDPRGISRSTCDDAPRDDTPEMRADDVHHLLSALGRGAADVFGSSGGAITGLALVTRHPEQVRTLVAHEPPLTELLADSAVQRAAIDDIHDTHGRHGQDAAMRKFFAMAEIEGAPGPADGQSPQPPDPEQAAALAEMRADTDYFLAHMIRPTTRYRSDIAAL